MNKKFLVALGVMVAIIIFLVFSLYFSGDYPFTGPGLPKKPTVKTQATPEPKEKPAPTTAPAPTPAPKPAQAPAPKPAPAPATQAPPTPPPAPPAAPPEKPLTKPEATAPGPPKTELPPLQPTEEYGLLVGRYRSYRSAGKKMEKLKKKDLPAFIRRDKGRYQVWVGPFATRQEARKAAKTIKAKRRRPPRIQKITIPIPK